MGYNDVCEKFVRTWGKAVDINYYLKRLSEYKHTCKHTHFMHAHCVIIKQRLPPEHKDTSTFEMLSL